MIDLNLPFIFVPLVGLLFSAIVIVSLFLYVQKKNCLDPMGLNLIN